MVDVENQPHLATQKPDFGHRQMAGQPGPPLPHAQTVWNGEGPDFTMADVEREHELAKLAAQPVWNGEGPEYDMKDVELTAEADRLKAATEAAAYVEGAAHNGEGAGEQALHAGAAEGRGGRAEWRAARVAAASSQYSMTQTKGY
eukprot:scaffold1.g5784.t1